MKTLINSEKEISTLIEKYILPKILQSKQNKKATTIGLFGNLGSGKTTFTKYFAEKLNINKEKIISPTFIILKRFDIDFEGFKNFYHLDVYRIDSPTEIEKIGWQEIISDPHNLIIVEWADKIAKILPPDIIKINFSFIDEEKREIEF